MQGSELLQNQLDDLRTDILNGVLKEEQIKEYIDREKNDLNVFSRRFNEFYDLQKKESNYFYASCPIIDSFIVKLKNEANQE